jgi:hypothetical protein
MESSHLQISSGAFDLATNSIPLEKYSSAVSPEGSRNHRWVHDVRRDLLTLTFKTVDIPVVGNKNETRLVMAVTAGRDSLVRPSSLASWRIEVDALFCFSCVVCI